MSERIYQAVHDDFVRRMRNWARFKDGAPVSTMTLQLGCRVDRYRETQEPLLCGEAEDTEKALLAIPERYSQAVQQFWRNEARSLRWHGRHRRVHHATFETWVIKGHDFLRAELERASEAWRKRRDAARAAGAGA